MIHGHIGTVGDGTTLGTTEDIGAGTTLGTMEDTGVHIIVITTDGTEDLVRIGVTIMVTEVRDTDTEDISAKTDGMVQGTRLSRIRESSLTTRKRL